VENTTKVGCNARKANKQTSKQANKQIHNVELSIRVVFVNLAD
jgi:hypothetical protein